MIPFDKKLMCPRCENEILVGGYVMLPGVEEIRHYCFACAVEEVKDHAKANGRDIKTTMYLTEDQLTDEDEQ